jgi:thymidylate kinase
MHPGKFVVIIGPDGVGKTSLARELLARGEGVLRYFHFRPDSGLVDSMPPSESMAKFRDRSNPIAGVFRILVSAARFWIGYLRYIRPERAAGISVVGDRWGYGYLVQPGALRYSGPEWLAQAIIRLLPQPDLVVNLHAEPELIRGRKDELTLEEIANELSRWRQVPARRLLHVDASASLEEMVDLVWSHLR